MALFKGSSGRGSNTRFHHRTYLYASLHFWTLEMFNSLVRSSSCFTQLPGSSITSQTWNKKKLFFLLAPHHSSVPWAAISLTLGVAFLQMIKKQFYIRHFIRSSFSLFLFRLFIPCNIVEWNRMSGWGSRAIQSEKKKFACNFFLSSRLVLCARGKKEWKTQLVQDSRLQRWSESECFSIRNLSYYFSTLSQLAFVCLQRFFFVYFCMCSTLHWILNFGIESEVQCTWTANPECAGGKNCALLSWTCLNCIWNWFRRAAAAWNANFHRLEKLFSNSMWESDKGEKKSNKKSSHSSFFCVSHFEYFLNWKNIVNASLKSIGEEWNGLIWVRERKKKVEGLCCYIPARRRWRRTKCYVWAVSSSKKKGSALLLFVKSS